MSALELHNLSQLPQRRRCRHQLSQNTHYHYHHLRLSQNRKACCHTSSRIHRMMESQRARRLRRPQYMMESHHQCMMVGRSLPPKVHKMAGKNRLRMVHMMIVPTHPYLMVPIWDVLRLAPPGQKGRVEKTSFCRKDPLSKWMNRIYRRLAPRKNRHRVEVEG